MNKKLVILLSCLAVIVVIVICMSIAFTIDEVNVKTTNGLTIDEEVINDIILDSGIVAHSSIFGLEESTAISNIEKMHPELKVISIERKFPNDVYINISKRIPILSVAISDGSFALLDRELKVVEIVSEVEGAYITPITGISVNQIQKGSFVEFEWLKPIISSAEDLSFVNERFSTLITKIERVTYEDLENQTLLTTNTGVVFVIDDNLGTDAFNSFYTYYINEKNVTNQDHGYIYYDPEEKSLKHKDSLI